jgi:hypothetical protein
MAELPSATMVLEFTTRVDSVLLAVPASNANDTGSSGTESTVAVTVLISALVELRVAENFPAALVVPEACVRMLDVPLLDNDTVLPESARPVESFAETVRVAVEMPSATMVFGFADKLDAHSGQVDHSV